MSVKTEQREVRIEYMRLDEIQRDLSNPKEHDLSALAESLDRFGFVSPMGINEKTGKLLWGHGRLDDLIAFMDEGKPVLEGLQVDGDGMWKAPVVRGVHLNPKDGTAYLISDNRQVELGGWNEPKLVETLIRIASEDGFGLRGTGYDGDDVDLLIRLYRPDLLNLPEDPGPQIDRAAELQKIWNTQLGQIWEMGDHRLAVGDCTEKVVVDAVMMGEKAGAVVTDPPYGIQLETDYRKMPETRIASKHYPHVIGDDKDFDPSPLITIFEDVQEQFWWGANHYYHLLPPGGSWIVWDKRNEASDGLIGSHFEMCWSRTQHRQRMIRKHWAGVNARNPEFQRMHPTEKSIEVLEEIIGDYTSGDNIIVDLFCGVGTTIIACERLGRRCRAIEIDPGYCAVAIQRWVDMTGLEPRLMTS